ncbi:uncharacterized protein MEPE_03581 [Melanopsichium pennsylvanicum]|uniref:Uncharacterized protein n=1 Tax=Melanopsichium pennsylvanicum TaxID=63383 RepID=A0AAJ5C5L7_9BASI|nr:uncharacterized protein MEPE_03581 [Melanopsichium pennsylvanicum]
MTFAMLGASFRDVIFRPTNLSNLVESPTVKATLRHRWLPKLISARSRAATVFVADLDMFRQTQERCGLSGYDDQVNVRKDPSYATHGNIRAPNSGPATNIEPVQGLLTRFVMFVHFVHSVLRIVL